MCGERNQSIRLKFRPFTADDFPLMLEWLSREHVRQWWDDGEDTPEKIARNYGEDEGGLGRYILVAAEAGGEKPLGYFQHYLAPDGSIGIDQFIGEEDYINRGVGTQAVRIFVELIRREHEGASIILDPAPDNKRAIRCYEKVGFRHYATKEGSEGGLAYLMRLDARTRAR
jgi:aminoglycoside 6'-N-acetyltransferase